MTPADLTALIASLSDESDLCRNEDALDIANLLDEAIAALREMAKDAERWQFGCAHGFPVAQMVNICSWYPTGKWLYGLRGKVSLEYDSAGAAIDAARSPK